jgi:hypothetical protein
MRQMPPSHYRSAPRAHQGANRRLLAPYMFARTERPTRLRVRATPSVLHSLSGIIEGLGPLVRQQDLRSFHHCRRL